MITDSQVKETFNYIVKKYKGSGVIICNALTFEIVKEYIKMDKRFNISQNCIMFYNENSKDSIGITPTGNYLEENKFDCLIDGRMNIETIMTDNERKFKTN